MRHSLFYFEQFNQMHFSCGVCGKWNIHQTSEDREFYTCPRCGTDFDAITGEEVE